MIGVGMEIGKLFPVDKICIGRQCITGPFNSLSPCRSYSKAFDCRHTTVCCLGKAGSYSHNLIPLTVLVKTIDLILSLGDGKLGNLILANGLGTSDGEMMEISIQSFCTGLP